MGVDVVNINWFKIRSIESHTHAKGCTSAIYSRGGYMESVVRAAIARQFSQNSRTSRFGIFQGFEYQHCCTLPHDESGPIQVEGTTGAGRISAIS